MVITVYVMSWAGCFPGYFSAPSVRMTITTYLMSWAGCFPGEILATHDCFTHTSSPRTMQANYLTRAEYTCTHSIQHFHTSGHAE